MQPMNILNVAEPVIYDNQILKIPSILEVIDLKKKVFKVSAVALKKAPIMMCHYKHYPISIVLDTGAEHNVISDTVVKRLSMNMLETSSKAVQVDKSPLCSVGRISICLSNGGDSWLFDALVCTNIGDVVIAGNPFLAQGINPITYRNITEIVSSDGTIRTIPWRPVKSLPAKPVISLLRIPEKVTVYPDEFLDISVPPEMAKFESSEILLLPRMQSKAKMLNTLLPTKPPLTDSSGDSHPPPWSSYEFVPFPPPQFSHIVGGKIRILNPSPLPITVNRNNQIADIRLVVDQDPIQFDQSLYPKPKPSIPVSEVHKICCDPDNQLTTTERDLFTEINCRYSSIFSSKLGRYNGSLGNLNAKIILNNDAIDPPSFPCKRIIQTEKLEDMKQNVMDQMEADGILVRPEDVGVTLTHVHPSFLVPKMEDGVPTGEYRLVTNLQSLSPYIKPTRIPLPTIDDAFRQLGKWKFIIHLDLRSWHWQIPMQKSSMRYLGTSTPYGGDRVYAVQPQGYLNATENSDRVIQKVLEPALRQKKCIRMADNMIVGGSTVSEAAENYELILKLCGGAGLTFKASKTVICPKRVNILGKVWNNGYLYPSEHLQSTLANVPPPVTVKQMRSFLGGCKQMKDNITNYSELFRPLEKVTGGRKSGEKLVWNDSLRAAFESVQRATKSPDILALAKPGEKLFIFPDWSDENQSGGGPLYVKREGKWKKVRNFCQRLRTAKRWSPCEGEAWMIRVAVENHSPWIWHSGVPCEVGTDNNACVLSFQRLRRGQFSRSVRVAFLLSTLAEHNVYLVHRSGANHPGDYDSRHPVECNLGLKCQVCVYAHNLAGPMAQELAHPAQAQLPEDVGSKKAFIAKVSVDDVLSGKIDIPFTQRAGWKNIQDEDKTLRALRRHMAGGTIPPRRKVVQPELRKLYNLFQHQKLTISKDGLIVKITTDNFGNSKEVIVVPKLIMKGLLTALHIKFDHPHPSKPELKKICDRYWFSTDLNSQINSVWLSCHKCQSLAPIPKEIFEQSTSKSGKLGTMWSADVIRGDQQFIFITREKLSSFTVTKLIDDEKSETLREAIISTTAELIPEEGLSMQVDNCPALVALASDAQLERFKIHLDVARKKNKDSNPVAEKAVKEFRQEKLKFKPEGGKISETERSIITSSLNKLIRGRNVSSKEIILNRDQFTSENLNLSDSVLADEQLQARRQNHPVSAKSKVKKGVPAKQATVWPGALVFLKKDLTKLKGRELYIVVSLDANCPEFCLIKKAVKQLRVENYKVKLTEIVLSPNQEPPKHSVNANDIILENDVSEGRPKYNLRQKNSINYKKLNDGTGVIDMAFTKKMEKMTPIKYAWDSFDTDDECDDYKTTPTMVSQFESWCSQQSGFLPPLSIFIHWFKDKYPAMDTKRLQSLAEDLVKLVDVTKPEVSSDSSCVLSENESAVEPEDSCDDLSSSLSSIPLGQGSTRVPNDDLIDTAPTARNSSTDATMLDEITDQIHTPSMPPQLPRIQERNQSVITCPTGTCNLNTIEEPSSIEENLDTFDDEVFSPPVTPENYPILFSFLNQTHSEAAPRDGVDVIEANQHDAVQPPPEPPDEQAIDQFHFHDQRPRRFPRVDYQALHEYGGQKEGF